MASEINKERLKRFITLVENAKNDDWFAAINMTLSPDEFTELAKHDNPEVRQAVMWHPQVPIDVLTRGAKDDDAVVRGAVMINNNTPCAVLFEGLEDKDELVRAYAIQSLRMILKWQLK
jgi:hypothetical protein